MRWSSQDEALQRGRRLRVPAGASLFSSVKWEQQDSLPSGSGDGKRTPSPDRGPQTGAPSSICFICQEFVFITKYHADHRKHVPRVLEAIEQTAGLCQPRRETAHPARPPPVCPFVRPSVRQASTPTRLLQGPQTVLFPLRVALWCHPEGGSVPLSRRAGRAASSPCSRVSSLLLQRRRWAPPTRGFPFRDVPTRGTITCLPSSWAAYRAGPARPSPPATHPHACLRPCPGVDGPIPGMHPGHVSNWLALLPVGTQAHAARPRRHLALSAF